MPLDPPYASPADEPKRLRIFRVSTEMLAEVLLLPPGTRIVDVSGQLYFNSGDIAFKVENAAFDPVPRGHVIPEAVPTYSEVRVPKFDGWQAGGRA